MSLLNDEESPRHGLPGSWNEILLASGSEAEKGVNVRVFADMAGQFETLYNVRDY